MFNRFLPALTLALAAAAQDQPARSAGAGINFFGIDQEIAMGAQLAESVRRETRPLGSPAVQDYVDRLGRQLVAHAGGAAYPYSFTIVRDLSEGLAANPTEEPKALPGGPIFLSAKLILEAQTEAELAGMLAHSIAHVAERHETRTATRANLMQIGAIAVSQAGVTNPVALSTLRFRQTFEKEADRRAVQIMSQAGYDPAALADYIGRPRHADPGTVAEVFSKWPPVKQRLAAINDAISALPTQTYTAGLTFPAIQDEVRRLTEK